MLVLPRLTEVHATEPLYRDILIALREGGFRGELCTDYSTRLLAATDNSIYQVLPEAVIFPRDTADIALAMRVFSEERFRAATLAPRGGGTGTNGQSLSSGVTLDVSRHMNAVLEVNLEEGWARVQPGVVLDQLNAQLKPSGVFFAPNLSPSNRATIGGMISTDACGKGSRIYGRTSNHVLELTTVFRGGEVWTSRPLTPAELEGVKRQPGFVGELHRSVHAVLQAASEAIAGGYRPLARFMTGYNLAMSLDPQSGRFDLNPLLCGSEGTLGVVAEAKVRLTPLPKHKTLVLLRYGRFEDALASAQMLLDTAPAAIETIDQTVLALAREDAIYYRVKDLLDLPGEPHAAAINLVEYQHSEEAEVAARVRALEQSINEKSGVEHRGALGMPTSYTVARTAEDAAALWDLRKKGVGLLGAAKTVRKPIPFVEDTVVPPQHLQAYVSEFRALLDAHGLTYGMFGHVDVGCLHVRPALDMKDPADERLIRTITDQVAALANKYGGVLWGEHGKGFRSEYNPMYFGDALYGEMRKIKAIFDPQNQLNPGKLATPAGSDAQLANIDGPTRGQQDRQVSADYQRRFAVTLSCNGNGLCYNFDPNSVMCPSSKVTRDRVHSPKGRAAVMREWLRQLSRQGLTSREALRPAPGVRPAAAVARWFRSLGPKTASSDYSHDVYQAMQGCLACKACATQCPVKVDVPAFRADFLEIYHERYARPLKDIFVANLEFALPLLAKSPRVSNWLSQNALSRWILKAVVGLVDTPALSSPTAQSELEARRAPLATAAALQALPASERSRVVVLVPDAFTWFYEAPVFVAAYDALVALGYRPHVAPYLPNGKGLHVKGFLRRFEAVARKQVDALAPLAAAGAPLVCLDPAVALTYRDEYPHVLGAGSVPFRVELLQEWLAARAEEWPKRSPQKYRLFAHCTERTLALDSQRQWRVVFGKLGLELAAVDLGCCGMCGAFGHEQVHLEESRGIWEMSWAVALSRSSAEALATGHSCRSQAKRFAGVRLRHPVEVLAQGLALRAGGKA
jgi:FAD/FMN-containing dehydrogenase/Fe-S oxidoreductase